MNTTRRLEVEFLGKRLDNPLVLTSGILGTTGASLANVVRKGAGAVTTKSIGPKVRKGHPNPCVLPLQNAMINAVGLSNPGASNYIEEIEFYKNKTKEEEEKENKHCAPIIASIFGASIEEFVSVAKKISKAKPDFIELNISCPNVQSEFGVPFGTDKKITEELVKQIKKVTKIPIIVKLTPNTPDINEIAKAAEDGGADAISAINTVGPGMVIDIETGHPILSNKVGGISGPAIKPIAVRCVYQIREATELPIIGIGGVTTAEDAIEMMMAGANLIGIGSGVYFRGMQIFEEIKEGIQQYMKKKSITNLNEIVGLAHKHK